MQRHNHSDHLSKNILRDALSRASTSETEVEVLAATQRIDVYAVPDPARAAERGQMGLLGWLSEEPSLFEPFRNTPSLARVRHCLRKQLTWHHELERRARAAAGKAEEDADADAPSVVPFPWLVIISPGRPETVLDVYGCKEVRRGVYEAVAGLASRVVVLTELRRERESLLLRLLGTGRLLGAALADLSALPPDAWERSIATPLLLHFGLASDGPPAANEEDDVSEEIRAWYEDYQRQQEKLRADERSQGRDEGRNEGRNEGRAEEAARALLTVLRARGIMVPDAARERIVAEKDADRLERWLEKAAVVASVAEVLGEPS
jgi:hypothetical protein